MLQTESMYLESLIGKQKTIFLKVCVDTDSKGEQKSNGTNGVDAPSWKIWHGTADFPRFSVFHLVFFFQLFSVNPTPSVINTNLGAFCRFSSREYGTFN